MKRLYRVPCHECGYPARDTLLVDETNGAEEFRLCVNPTCMFYDHAAKGMPKMLEQREAAYRKHLDILLPPKEPVAGRQQSTPSPSASLF